MKNNFIRPFYIVVAVFILLVFSTIFLITLRVTKLNALTSTDVSRALGCDTSFFNINALSGYSFSSGCLDVNEQLYTGDSRYVLFRLPDTVPVSGYIKTPNVGIKDSTSLNWSVDVTKNTRVYLLSRYIPGRVAPAWMRDQYTKITNNDMSNINQFVLRKNDQGLIGLYEIYTKDVTAGRVPFYAASDDGNAYSMYMVALKPLSGNLSPSATATVRPSATATVRPSATVLPSVVPSGSIRFVSWGDTKSGLSTLTALSGQVKMMDPLFTIYAGDLCSSGFSTSCIAPWKTAINGGVNNGVFDKTFAVRGNHDSSDAAGWNNYFKFSALATRIGATHFSGDNLTYSFDVGNLHIAGVDVLGDAGLMSSTQRSWLDADLTAAEARGVVHTFVFWHGPIYPVAEHCCSDNSWATAIMNKHPSVSASFHGHEHVYAYVHIDSSRYANVTHPFEQFVTGDAGAGPNTCKSGRTDYCMQKHGFVTVDVNGRTFSVSMYSQGASSPEKVWTFTK